MKKLLKGRWRRWGCQKAKLFQGAHVCPYCDNHYGRGVRTEDGVVRLRPTIDHIVPRSRGGDENDERNMIVCCQLCNKIKADLIFFTIESARRGIQRGWKNRGWEAVNMPDPNKIPVA